MNTTGTLEAMTASTAEPATAEKDRSPVRKFAFRDRKLPFWAQLISAIFSVASNLVWVSISIFALLFIDIAVSGANNNLVYIFSAVGLVTLCAGFILEVAHIRALKNLSLERKNLSLKINAAFAFIVGVFLAIIHPTLCIGFFVGSLVHYLTPLVRKHFPSSSSDDAFSHAAAVSMLSGRDTWGVEHYAKRAQAIPSLAISFTRLSQALAVLITLGISSWLTIQGIITVGAIFASTLMTYWAVLMVSEFSQNAASVSHYTRIQATDYQPEQPTTQTDIFSDEVSAVEIEKGLVVEALSIKDSVTRKVILGETRLRAAPGQIIGITGESGGGKSILLQAIVGQTNDKDLLLKGAVLFDGVSLWGKNHSGFGVPNVFAPSIPVMLPGTACENLLCFDPTISEIDALNALLKIDVFGAQSERVVAQQNAKLLSSTEAQLLSLARAFYLNPGLYLLDMPEANLTKIMVNTLISQIGVEKNSGRTFVIASRNRNILDICDEVLVMDGGHVIDRGSSSEVQERQASGWNRIILPRSPESEERLQSWTRTKFNRKGDEGNRRNACLLVSELLALSCTEEPPTTESIIFDFKHFKGHCQIAIQDTAKPISTALIQTAQKKAAGKTTISPKHPLANILSLTSDFTQKLKGMDAGYNREIQVKLDVVNPRTISKK